MIRLLAKWLAVDPGTDWSHGVVASGDGLEPWARIWYRSLLDFQRIKRGARRTRMSASPCGFYPPPFV